MSAINVSQLRKEFGGLGRAKIVAVEDIDLEIGQGEFFTIVGPSGCGKTTTLRCIAGLEQPTSGTITFNGTEVTTDPPNERNLAMMFQNIALYPHMNIRDNIAYPMKVRHVPKDVRNEEVEKAAEVMQIGDLLDKYPGELSGGQQQRAALARTLVQEPVAFLMDEPLSDLDAKLKVEMRKEVQRVHRRVGKPTIYVTHDQEEAMTMSDRIAVMNDGHVEQIGSPDELYHHPVNQFVANFIGMPSMNFLEGHVESLTDEEGTVTVQGQEFHFPVEYRNRDATGEDVNVGFRPEIVRLKSEELEPDFHGEVQLLERIGDRVLASLEGPEGEIRATISADDDVEEGETVPISVNRSGLYLFDRETGELIAKGERKRRA